MKRWICAVLITVMLLSLTGCCIRHSWAEATCLEPKTCMKCGKTEGDALGHDYSEWITVKEPSYLSPGQRAKECSRCEKIVTEDIPKLDTDYCKIVDSEGMTVTYEECYYLLGEVLSGRTSYMDLNYEFTFTKNDNANIRFMKCDGLDTSVMVTLMKKGDEPAADEKIDYILISQIGTMATIEKKLVYLKAASAAAILITRADINDGDAALKEFSALSQKGTIGNWVSYGPLEYKCDITSVGTNTYMVIFAARVKNNY